MLRRWVKKYKEYPFKLIDKKCKEITIPVNEDLTWYLEKVEEVVQLTYILEVTYGIKPHIYCSGDIECIIECLKHLEEILK